MEHALPTPPNLPWRTIAVVAAGIATLELLGLVVAGAALLARPAVHHARAAAAAGKAAGSAKAPSLPLLPRRRTSVTILNGNGVAGAAAAEASRARARGYIVGRVGNARQAGYGESVVMYRPGRRREAVRLARDLGIRLVSPLDGLSLRDLHAAKLAVVVGG